MSASRTQIRRDIETAKATLAAVRELRRTVEALRSTPAPGGDPIANRVRNSYLDSELERLDDAEREFAIDLAACRTRLVESAEAAR